MGKIYESGTQKGRTGIGEKPRTKWYFKMFELKQIWNVKSHFDQRFF